MVLSFIGDEVAGAARTPSGPRSGTVKGSTSDRANSRPNRMLTWEMQLTITSRRKYLLTMAKARRIKQILAAAGMAAILVMALVVGFSWTIHYRYRDRISSSVPDVPFEAEPRIAIVLGAGLWRGKPSPVLYDRIATGVDLYRAGKVRKLLLSGDNRFENYNEPAAMRQKALQMGVPDQDIVPDYAGRHTYDTCYRAAYIFGIRRAILVTQRFHLDRALYICNSLGVDSIGVAADRQSYGDYEVIWWSLREVPAMTESWGYLHLLHPTPVMGDRIPVDQGEGG
jgi:SanA protein